MTASKSENSPLPVAALVSKMRVLSARASENSGFADLRAVFWWFERLKSYALKKYKCAHFN